MKYDLDLFRQLNAEYESKPLVRKARKFNAAALNTEGSSRAIGLVDSFAKVTNMPLTGKRILEIGCGRGNTTRAVADALGCEIIGIDVEEYPHWTDNRGRGVEFYKIDIGTEDYSHLGQFDFAYSFAVWEHIHHPYSSLKAMRNLLKPWSGGTGGAFYLNANLYRGPKASHRYREVYFPWPHLLFDDEVFREYYASIGKKDGTPAWVNKLVSAEYLSYFQQLGFNTRSVSYRTTPIDEEFYARFEDVLGRYPRFDLERDFIIAMLTIDE